MPIRTNLASRGRYWTTAYHRETEIARRLLGSPQWIEWITLGHFSRRWLIKAYLQ